VSELLMVEQRSGGADAAPWILDRHGRRLPGYDDGRRLAEVRAGLARHPGVRATTTEATNEDVERVLRRLHEPDYLDALRRVNSDEPALLPEWAPPGLPADSPVCAAVVAAAHEGARTAVTAAQRIRDGARFAYALSRPPGHHAGPAWLGGYCYLNTAAAAAQTLCDGGVKPVTILDLDFHFPTGTSAVVARLTDVDLHSLHASTSANVPWRPVRPHATRERFVEFVTPPDDAEYLDAVAASIDPPARRPAGLVLSLGYDTVAGDPHGSWSFAPAIFAEIGRLLASAQMPVCIVQEGGYGLDVLAACSHALATGLLDGGCCT
jgi:acetoin utilization deacetylase AcuC-like enzyme